MSGAEMDITVSCSYHMILTMSGADKDITVSCSYHMRY